ncbi:MAG: type IV toxin-antitoxin system AbiEi family antitoxin domain-containing protein [Planctomycetota bacterium]|nr:type IV toxin-antitoxin system AbiEi family antitoxin domain-containing protein [Planctomycetota bacterium]
MAKSAPERIVELAGKAGLLRPRDLDERGIPRFHLTGLVREGRLLRVGRGLYMSADAQPTEHLALAEACKRVPHGVLCLLSALQYHGLTTQLPREVWLAIGVKARRPKVDVPAIRVCRFSGEALTAGVEDRRIEGVPVRVYNVPKTVADCFKYRNKIGLDVALEALRDARRRRKCSADDLWKYAKTCRVANVMRPYLEALG